MKILTSLVAHQTDGEWKEPRGVLQVICDEPKPGVIRQISLGAAGILIKRGKISVGIPLAELMKLAEAFEPELGVK